ncbi:uncharacterized protein LOC128181946 [Crassostrea angulata]|uniref:uncharacterized protein LOC128181946 n=1 Tax=Magallana angulata TaxID=2784310 RepID=UPI0022B1C35B|nr:uncharacterized protein LOC128181946 [Crassostrea angulata]
MAAISSKYPFGSAQEHIPTCEKHDLMIDMTCEDCDEFICSQCAKINHKNHNWKTISTAGIQRRKDLKKTLSKVKEKDLKDMDDKIKKSGKLMEDNRKLCDSEVFKLQKHYDEIVSKLDEIKKNIETKLRENLERKNAEVREKKLDLEKKTKQAIDLVKFLEEKHSTISDYSLIDNLRDLINFVANADNDIEKRGHSVRYRKGDISVGLLESMMGQTFDLNDVTVSETDSFQYGDKSIAFMEAIKEDICFIGALRSDYIKQVNKKNKTGKKLNKSNVNDVCITRNGDLYVTDSVNESIVRLSPSGAVSSEFSTAPLKPLGICQSTGGGLLVVLMDVESEKFKPDFNSRRLVRHVTLTGDVICEYEYLQEYGQPRLFTNPWRVRQNGNTDICVVNKTSKDAGELVILSVSGSLRCRYNGQKLVEEFKPTDVVCDSHCNIIVNDIVNSKIHLLSPDGEFMKYLLTENELTRPWSMSLYKSNLWIGNFHGLVKVFQFKETLKK